MNIFEVVPGKLYMRGDLRGVKRATKLATLDALEIDVVVCLVRIPDPDMRDMLGIEYIHAPLADSKTVDEKRVLEIRDAVVARIRAGHTALVHCVQGKNRAGLVASLVTAELLGVPPMVALDIVRAARPGAVYRDSFEAYLKGGIL